MSTNEIGEYVVGKTLGCGMTSKVKLVTRKRDGCPFAMKRIRKDSFSERPILEQKVQREISLLRALDHPSILKLIDVYESTHHIFLITELAQRGELFDYLVEQRCLSEEEAMRFFRQIIYGIDYLHTNCICHRDLKLENILLDKDNNVKICDFGLAKWVSDEMTGTACGSPHYTAPEIIKLEHYDGRKADIWSCGIILFALVTVCFFDKQNFL